MSGGEARELRRLATLERNRGDEQVRWSWDEFTPDDGEPTRYVSGRKWYRTDDGEWRPTKAGITIRLSELDEVVAALQRVLRARAKSGNGANSNAVDGAVSAHPQHAGTQAAGGRRPTHTTRSPVSSEELDEQEVF